jgi:polyphosphate glucokinase
MARSAPNGTSHQKIGIALPAVVHDGITRTAANIDPSWHDLDAGSFLTRHAERTSALINDADAAGLAEMRFGEGQDQKGITLMVTLGTGIGSSVFVDGVLLPNTELGHLHINGMIAEQ